MGSIAFKHFNVVYDNLNTMCILIGQKPMGYCAGKLIEHTVTDATYNIVLQKKLQSVT